MAFFLRINSGLVESPQKTIGTVGVGFSTGMYDLLEYEMLPCC